MGLVVLEPAVGWSFCRVYVMRCSGDLVWFGRGCRFLQGFGFDVGGV